MNGNKERFFDYAKAIESAKYAGNKNQREISEELEVSEVHVSQIVNEKSSTTLAKTLKMLNDFNLCIDDFVEEPYRTKMTVKYEDKKMFGSLSDAEIIILIDFIRKFQYLKAHKENTILPDNRSIAKQVGRRIRELRQKRDISERTMAQALAMQQESYRNIESGVGTVMDNYVVIAKILNVPMGVLFSDFVRNKKSIMQYEMGELFGEIGIQERKSIREFLEIMLTVYE